MAIVRLKNMADGKVQDFEAVDAREILANPNNDFVIVGDAPKGVQPKAERAPKPKKEEEVNFWAFSLTELKAFADDAGLEGAADFKRKKKIIGALQDANYKPPTNQGNE